MEQKFFGAIMLPTQFASYKEGDAAGEIPEAEMAQPIEEGEGSGDFLYFSDSDFVGDAVMLEYADGVSQLTSETTQSFGTNNNRQYTISETMIYSDRVS